MNKLLSASCAVLVLMSGNPAIAQDHNPVLYNGPHIIINGPGLGAVLDVINNLINDFDAGNIGYIQDHNYGPHYHGYLYHNPDPNPNGIGWGNVIPHNPNWDNNPDTNFIPGADIPISDLPVTQLPGPDILLDPGLVKLDHRDGIAAVSKKPIPTVQPDPPGRSLTNQNQMVGWFESAISRWNEKHADDFRPPTLKNSAGDYGLWNFSQYLKRYGQEWEGDTDTYKQFITGKEFELKKQIIAEFEKTKKKLDPGQVFELALEMFDGDVFKALLCSHNTIRAIARGREPFFLPDQPAHSVTVTQVGDNKLYTIKSEDPDFGYSADQQFFKDYLVQLTEGSTDILESSVWYHTFGTALAGMKFGGWAARRMVDLEDIYVDITTDTGRHPILNTTDYWGVEVGLRLEGIVKTAQAAPPRLTPMDDGIAPVR